MNRFKINNGWIELIVENDYYYRADNEYELYSTSIRLSSVSRIKTYKTMNDGIHNMRIIELLIDGNYTSIHYYKEEEHDVFIEDAKMLMNELGMIYNE